jgi:hypothetical protein
MLLSIKEIRKAKKNKKKDQTHFETTKEFREINDQIIKQLDRIRKGFSVEQVPMTRWEKSQMITASEFLQI